MNVRTLLCFLIVGFSMLGCVKEPNMIGGHDGGGGVSPKSTPAEVKAAITMAFKLATADDLRRNIFRRFMIDGAQETYADRLYYKMGKVELIFPELSGMQPKPLRWKDQNLNVLLRSPVIDALKTAKLNLLEQGYCPAPDKHHADASVSKFAFDAEICFSVESLTRIPKSALYKEVFSLLFHETVHMAGGDEKEANQWQELFAEYYAANFGYMAERKLEDEHRSIIIKSMGMLLASLLTLQQPDFRDEARAVSVMTAVAAQLATMPKMYDPIVLEISLKPKRPEFLNNYVNSILATMSQGWKLTSLGLIFQSVKEGKEPTLPSPLPTGKELDNYVQLMFEQVGVIATNLKSVVGGSEKSTCLLPEGHLSELLTLQLSEGDILMLGPAPLPPRVCDPDTKVFTFSVQTNPDSGKPESRTENPESPAQTPESAP